MIINFGLKWGLKVDIVMTLYLKTNWAVYGLKNQKYHIFTINFPLLLQGKPQQQRSKPNSLGLPSQACIHVYIIKVPFIIGVKVQNYMMPLLAIS